MKSSLIIIAIIFLSLNIKSQNIALEGSQTAFFSEIQTAIDTAQNGDTIYVPSGMFVFGEILIDKQLRIIGYGAATDSTVDLGPTILNGIIRIQNGANNCSLEGFEMQSGQIFIEASSNVSSLEISRVRFPSLKFEDNSSLNGNFEIKQCDFFWLDGQGLTGLNLSNCIVRDIIVQVDLGVIENSMFTDNFSSSLSDCSFITFRNNIVSNSISLHSSNGLTNMLCTNNILNGSFGINSSSSNIAINNLTSQNLSNILVDENGGDFRIVAGSVAQGFGTNGSDPGIYDGPYPWKDGSLPAIPHIYFQDIPAVTNSDGDLPVLIKANAQN